ncbi:MAG: hypothetical protein ACK4L7_06215, partial [Flavobacteriales bacterium]
MNDLRTSWALIAATLLLQACGDSPRSIPEDAADGDDGTSTGVFSNVPGGRTAGALDPAAANDLHAVVALEALPTAKYVYVRGREGDEERWIATLLQDIRIGRTYFYRGGLLKRGFESKEYGRTFDELYLVNQLVPADHGSDFSGAGGGSGSEQAAASMGGASNPVADGIPVKIAALVADPKKFEGKAVRLTGK